MATQKIAMGINLRQNKIEGSTAYGKYYPEVDTQKTLSLRGFAQHMTDHGSLYGRAIVEGATTSAVRSSRMPARWSCATSSALRR